MVMIGLTAYAEPVDRTDWQGQMCTYLPLDYAEMVVAAGGSPVLLPPRADLTPEIAGDILSRLDGLIICGGADVAADAYGQEPHPQTQPPHEERDHSELLLVSLARAQHMPLLGICRGMQVMAVEAGGTLEQHVPDRVGHEDHGPGPGVFGRRWVDVVPGTRASQLWGERVEVACYHHQAVAEHTGYVAAAWAADGTLEAMEDPEREFCMGVQWHPELSADSSIFRALVQAARGFAAERAR